MMEHGQLLTLGTWDVDRKEVICSRDSFILKGTNNKSRKESVKLHKETQHSLPFKWRRDG